MGVLRYNVSKSWRSDSVGTLTQEVVRYCYEVTSGMLCLQFSSQLCGSKLKGLVTSLARN